MLRAKGHRVGEVPGIGAAAYGIGLGILSGDGVVAAYAGLYGRVIQAHVEGLRISGFYYICQSLPVLFQYCRQLISAAGGGITAVHRHDYAAVFYAYLPAHNSQRFELVVTGLCAYTPAVVITVEPLHTQEQLLFLSADYIVFQNIVHQQPNGVAGILGMAGMAAHALCTEMPQLPLPPCSDRVSRLQLSGMDQGLGALGNDIAGHSAPDVRPLGNDIAGHSAPDVRHSSQGQP